MKFVYSIGSIILGVFFLIVTYKDGKTTKPNLTTSYIMHLRGYVGGVGFILLGIFMLIEAICDKG